MTNHTSHKKIYLIVFAWLVIFTVVEVAAAIMHIPRAALVAILLGTALGKAMLIALFFMHLKYENRWVWLLPGIPLFFAIFLICGIVPDIACHLYGNF